MISVLIKKAFLKYKSPNTILSFKRIELKDINHSHQTGVELMGEFFGSKLNSKERWDFIEEFFLGLKY